MMKRVRSFLSERSLSTPTPMTEIEKENVVNPMTKTLLIGVSTYDKGQEPCAMRDKSNTWEAMSDISDRDHDFLPVGGEETASDASDEVVSPDVLEKLEQLHSLGLYDRNHTPLLFAPETVLMIKKGAFVTSSPDGVEQLENDSSSDDSSFASDLSPIVITI